MFFRSWTTIAQTALVGVLAYAALILLLRSFGKRTLAKMNAFDFVVTIALGSTLSTILVSRDVPLADGLTALVVLLGLQYAVAWVSVRVPAVERLVKAQPSLLLYRGELRTSEMRRQRVSEEEVRSAVRSAGLADYREAGAVVLETDGTFSVVRSDAIPAGAAFEPLAPGP